MSLASLLKKGSLRGFATATPATFATHSPFYLPTVATVATVAVAKVPDGVSDAAPTTTVIDIGTVRPQGLSPALLAASQALDAQILAATNDPATNPETTVRTGSVRSEVRTESTELRTESGPTVGIDDPERWCYPHSTAMTGSEIDAFTARLARFTDKGLTTDDGEALADKLVTRDRESDDRRLCLECLHLAGYAGSWQCRNWQRAGVAIKARDAGLPGDLVRTLQRCDGVPRGAGQRLLYRPSTAFTSIAQDVMQSGLGSQ